MTQSDLLGVLRITEAGLYCQPGDFYIDPWRPVPRAVITHAHSDHARRGADSYLCLPPTEPILKSRLGQDITVNTVSHGTSLSLGQTRVSLHPAGHILGSAQVRIEYRGRVVVVTGDFKTAPDPTCQDFELLPCDGLVTESTFGLPVFRWQSDTVVAGEINAWWRRNVAAGKCSVLFGYALGKSQRVLSLLDDQIGKIYLHGALAAPTEIYRQQGVNLPATELVSSMPKDHDWRGAMVLAVPSAHGTSWMRRFGDVSTATASGWMQIRGNRRRRGFDIGFVLSDHADWPSLLSTVKSSGAEQVWVTHGYSDILAKYLTEQGITAHPVRSRFTGETLEADEQTGDDSTVEVATE